MRYDHLDADAVAFVACLKLPGQRGKPPATLGQVADRLADNRRAGLIYPDSAEIRKTACQQGVTALQTSRGLEMARANAFRPPPAPASADCVAAWRDATIRGCWELR
jgi:hypothetical protein